MFLCLVTWKRFSSTARLGPEQHAIPDGRSPFRSLYTECRERERERRPGHHPDGPELPLAGETGLIGANVKHRVVILIVKISPNLVDETKGVAWVKRTAFPGHRRALRHMEPRATPRGTAQARRSRELAVRPVPVAKIRAIGRNAGALLRFAAPGRAVASRYDRQKLRIRPAALLRT
jgi:hypothetical protein